MYVFDRFSFYRYQYFSANSNSWYIHVSINKARFQTLCCLRTLYLHWAVNIFISLYPIFTFPNNPLKYFAHILSMVRLISFQFVTEMFLLWQIQRRTVQNIIVCWITSYVMNQGLFLVKLFDFPFLVIQFLFLTGNVTFVVTLYSNDQSHFLPIFCLFHVPI